MFEKSQIAWISLSNYLTNLFCTCLYLLEIFFQENFFINRYRMIEINFLLLHYYSFMYITYSLTMYIVSDNITKYIYFLHLKPSR